MHVCLAWELWHARRAQVTWQPLELSLRRQSQCPVLSALGALRICSTLGNTSDLLRAAPLRAPFSVRAAALKGSWDALNIGDASTSREPKMASAARRVAWQALVGSGACLVEEPTAQQLPAGVAFRLALALGTARGRGPRMDHFLECEGEVQFWTAEWSALGG